MMYRFSKRSVDIVLSVVALVVLGPLMALIAIAIRATSRGPALFKQTRVGLHGRHFTCLKFRTMRIDAGDDIHREYVTRLFSEEIPPHGGNPGIYKIFRDPRVTPLGAWLRRTSLDELPQLLNVLQGTMTLVGPRPALPWEVELFGPANRGRLLVKPGITCLWQVTGRARINMREGLKFDLDYVERRCLTLDMVILLKTIRAVLTRDGSP